MISSTYVRLLADYNAWQNANIYDGAERLPDSERKRDCGAFFGSIHATLTHLLFADQAWLYRLGGGPQPRFKTIAESLVAVPDWTALRAERDEIDLAIKTWAAKVDDAWLAEDLSWYSNAAKANLSHPRWLLVTHMFNHQTHHRGQVHCLLTQAGVKPGDTDLPFMTMPK